MTYNISNNFQAVESLYLFLILYLALEILERRDIIFED